MLKQQLKDQLKESMLARDALRTSVLRMLLSSVSYLEINKGGAGYEATDEDVMNVIQKEVKQRRDSIEQFKAGGREEMAKKEEDELALLSVYLPKQMSEEEIEKLVIEAISSIGASTAQDMGKVMGYLSPHTKGKADGSIVSRIVREKLSSL